MKLEDVRYVVKKVTNEEGKERYEYTHIVAKEGLDGELVEVIKGRNIIDKENLEEALKESKHIYEQQEAKLTDESMAELMEQYREELDAELELNKKQIDTLTEMLEAIEKL